MTSWKLAACAAVAFLGSGMVATAQAQTQDCGSLANGYGPFDFRTQRGERLRLVESAHFRPQIEALISGKDANAPPGPDIDYTLRAYPNHHRALVAAVRLADRNKSEKPPGMRYTAECWLLRAVRFAPSDPLARVILAQFMVSKGRTAESLPHLAEAESLAGEDPFTHYNIGLVYLEAREYEHARRQAHRIRKLDFPRTDLQDRLRAAGEWREAASAASDGGTHLAPAAEPGKQTR